jgi:hypothetical protein
MAPIFNDHFTLYFEKENKKWPEDIKAKLIITASQ